MKRVIRDRMGLVVAFAVLVCVFSSMSVKAAGPLELMTTKASGSAFEMTLGEYDFDLYNRTSGWVLNGFYTQEDGKWSKNWLKTKLAPGKSFRMMWSSASDKGACVVPFKTTWDDYDKAEIYSLDWCKGIKSVYLKDTTFTVDYK